MAEEKDRWVLVTTDETKRGVFMGKLVSHDKDKLRCVLEQAQMAVYWPEETHGVLGLASAGPQKGSRIGPPVLRIELEGVTAVADCTPEAVQRWQGQPWN